jgi:hypothetical protein
MEVENDACALDCYTPHGLQLYNHSFFFTHTQRMATEGDKAHRGNRRRVLWVNYSRRGGLDVDIDDGCRAPPTVGEGRPLPI